VPLFSFFFVENKQQQGNLLKNGNMSMCIRTDGYNFYKTKINTIPKQLVFNSDIPQKGLGHGNKNNNIPWYVRPSHMSSLVADTACFRFFAKAGAVYNRLGEL
jgi:hypothetical protein